MISSVSDYFGTSNFVSVVARLLSRAELLNLARFNNVGDKIGNKGGHGGNSHFSRDTGGMGEKVIFPGTTRYAGYNYSSIVVFFELTLSRAVSEAYNLKP